MKDTIIVNDKSIPWLMVGNGFKIPSFNFSTEGTEVLGRAGSVFKDRQLKSYDFEIPLVIVNEWLSEKKSHDEILNALAVFFDYGNAVKLKLKSQDWYWWAYFDGPIELSPDIKQFEEFTIKVKLLDPYKYSDTTYKNMALNDSVSVYNDGTAKTFPIIKATALKDSTSFLISKNDDDYFMVGMSESAFKSTYKKKPRLLYDHFNSVIGWQYLPTGENVVIGDAGGIANGNIKKGSSGSYITIDKMGSRSGDGWVGPVVKKSLPRTAQNFRATIKLRINKEKTGVGKGYMYLYNERGEVFVAVGLLDGTNSKNEVRAHYILYNEYGEAWEWVDTVGAVSTKEKWRNTFDEDYIYLEISREDKVWNMKTWKYAKDDKGKTFITGRMHKTYTDRAGKYQRPLAQAGIALYGHTKYSLEEPVVDYIEINEILPSKNNIDMIIEKGDDIYIDMEKAIVTINERPALDEKDFGSDYFYLDKGVAELFIMPPNTFTTEVLWQDRFL